jgi:hypothetical protein
MKLPVMFSGTAFSMFLHWPSYRLPRAWESRGLDWCRSFTEAFWVCPECMNLNHPDQSERSNECQGFGFLTAQKKCQGGAQLLELEL